MKRKSDDKVKLFCGNVVIIGEELFADIIFTHDATFPTSLIKLKNIDSIKKYFSA